MSKSLIADFNFKSKNRTSEITNDYEVFPDKKLLDELRKKIIEYLIDQNIPEGDKFEDFIHEKIDNALEGYDLSNLERNHIYNLIDDEVNGYGPISELLQRLWLMDHLIFMLKLKVNLLKIIVFHLLMMII